MGGGLELYALEYGSLAGFIEYGNSCWFRNAPELSWLNLEIKAFDRQLVRAGLVWFCLLISVRSVSKTLTILCNFLCVLMYFSQKNNLVVLTVFLFDFP